MRFITVSGIDKAGKTSIIDEFMKRTNYRNYLVDRDPSNYMALNVVQSRIECEEQINLYENFMKGFTESVDLAVLLTCDDEELFRRFVDNNEPKLVGDYSPMQHQACISSWFRTAGYVNTLEINTTNKSIEECVNLIIDKTGEQSCQLIMT